MHCITRWCCVGAGGRCNVLTTGVPAPMCTACDHLADEICGAPTERGKVPHELKTLREVAEDPVRVVMPQQQLISQSVSPGT